MKLSAVLKRDLDFDPDITGVTADSRKAGPGILFCALPGTHKDGRDFIPQALTQGAAAILAPDDGKFIPFHTQPEKMVKVGDVRRAYALAAKSFYVVQPATIVAVTGTNGKTSVATFCRQMWASLGRHAASMGTLGLVSQAGETEKAITGPGLTTPDAADVARHLAELASEGVTCLAMEASSHGIDQRRLDGACLKAAAFTNLTQDHLDYHHTMEAYRAAKLRLFEQLLPRGRTAVLNADSEAYNAFAATAIMSGTSVLSVGERGAHLTLKDRRLEASGQILTVSHLGRDYDVRLPLAGQFQASNAMVAAGLLLACGEDVEAVLGAMASLQGARGRLEYIGRTFRGGEVYIDYAHTPDGLETVLSALRPHTKDRLVCVFGCGGDRDKTKRPIMGRIAEAKADIAIVTDDNPRSENPATIRSEILEGMTGRASEIGDRREAINHALEMLKAGDVAVIAGKGHEHGQIIGETTLPFDDAEIAREAITMLGR